MGGESPLRGVVGDGWLRGCLPTTAGMAVDESSTPLDMVVSEGEATDPAMISTDILVVGGDFKFR